RGPRASRCPASPSVLVRTMTWAKSPGLLTGPTTGVCADHVRPPLLDIDMNSNGGLPPLFATPNTYAFPLLSVRTVQPSMGLTFRLFAAGETNRWVQVLPPSEETATSIGAGEALGLFSWPLKDAQQMYTLPKNGLDDALSAHTCSLSENVVDDCIETMTEGIQVGFVPRRATVTLSVWEAAIASNPLKVYLPGKFAFRFA